MNQGASPPPPIPEGLTFVVLPEGFAQFHHLPRHVPLPVALQSDFESRGYPFEEGLGAMRRVLEEAPGTPGAALYARFVAKWPHLKAGEERLRAGRPAEAVPALLAALEADPECPLAHFHLGACFRASGDLDQAETFYRRSHELAPEAGWTAAALGRLFEERGEDRKAAEAYLEALRRLPGDAFLLSRLHALGEAFPVRSSSDPPGALVYVRRKGYEKLLREELSKLKDGNSLSAFGRKRLGEGLLELAHEAFERARVLDPGSTEPLLGLGECLLAAGKPEEAERWLAEVLNREPGSAMAHHLHFECRLALGDADGAWEALRRAVELDPGNADRLELWYALYREAGRAGEGMEELEALSAAHPEETALLLLLGRARREAGDVEGALAALEEARRRAPEDEAVLVALTSLLGEGGRAAEAEALLSGRRLSFALSVNRAAALHQLGRKEEAQEALQPFGEGGSRAGELSEPERRLLAAALERLHKEPGKHGGAKEGRDLLS